MSLRRVIFWLHLIAAISAGIVIFIMSATGVLLAFEKQVVAWADGPLRSGSLAAGQKRLPFETLASTLHKAGGAAPTTLTLYSGSPAISAAIGGSTFYLDGFTGEVLGASSTRVRAFFQTVTNLHRYLALSGERRPAGKALTGGSNLVFLFIVSSGFFLWWPHKIMNLKRGASGKARNWNWHNVFGFWASIPLFLIVLSATVISYPWASNLVYRITGTEPPPPTQNRNASTPGEIDLTGLDAAVVSAERQVPDWKTISLRLPTSAAAPLTFTIDRGTGGQPQLRSTLTMDRSGEVTRLERFEDQNTGRRARTWLRFLHTGEYYGLPGQAGAAVASFAALLLVWTGFALSWKRFKSWAVLSWTRRRGQPVLVRESEWPGEAQ